MISEPLRTVISGVALGVALVLTLALQSSNAACGPDQQSDYCSENYGLTGFPSAVGGRTSKPDADFPAVDNPMVPAAGRLVYADHQRIEQEARTLLQANKQFREDISPHRDKPDFDQLVRQFDYASGFDRTLPDQSMTLQERIDQADRELRRARDLYAFLAVYADEARFRADRTSWNEPDNQAFNCPAQPVADDPIADPPVVDWCNFAARMRESVREVAYLRMIFGQQFTADALGLHFSGTEIVGGEAFVIDEVRKLQMALEQYQTAQVAVMEGLTRALGSGCYVSDFYSQAEWALVSRAVDGKERAQHHIAVRKSYLDVYGPVTAQQEYRAAAVDQYVKLIGTAGLASRDAGERCTLGTRPDSAMLAEMVLRLLDTHQQSRTLRQGRNIFGLDVEFTPARPYRTAFGSNDTGILSEARRAAQHAKQLQSDEEAASRVFDQKAEKLVEAIQALKNGRDEVIQAESGCDRNDFDDDATYFACIEKQIQDLEACDVTAPDTPEANAAFRACVEPTLVSDMKKSRQELRAAFLQIAQVQKQIDNILQRVNAEDIRNVKVKGALLTNAQEQTAFAVVEAMAECCTVEIGSDGAGFSFNPAAPVVAAMRGASVMRQAAHDVEIEDAEKEAVVRNLFLDRAELQVDLEIAIQEFNAKLTEYQGIVGQTRHDVIEAQRERAYLQNSPANDPSYRLVRDSKRLTLADQLEYAARVSYLAARRAEYEYAARLSASNVRVSDIYRARTADDILRFLEELEATTNNMVVSDAEINQEDFRISVAQHILGLTDEFLGMTGDAAEAERTRRFRAWVAQNTEPGTDGKPVLTFNFTTSLVDNGIFSNVIQQAFDRFWLFKLAGTGQPKAGNTGMSMNLITDQSDSLGYRRTAVTQSGVTHLRTRAGCIFDYRLIHPAALVGQEWPANQPPEQATTDFKASINGANGERSAAFLGRPVSATDWQVQIFAGAPETGLPDLNLQQLTDIELHFSTTRASRTPGDPRPEDCVRADF
ncbi:MAG: hypothetical protein ACE5HA_03255 [Anaerolineae bacterium]